MTDNLKQVAEQISEDVEKTTRLVEYKKITEDLYNKNCVSACLDGKEGVDYEITNDVRMIQLHLRLRLNQFQRIPFNLFNY